MRLSRSLAALLLPLALARCSGMLPPYETVPVALTKADQQATATTDTPPTRIGICYNALTTTAEQVRAVAVQSCEPGTVPRAEQRDLSLGNCPLLQPARATFVCTAP